MADGLETMSEGAEAEETAVDIDIFTDGALVE